MTFNFKWRRYVDTDTSTFVRPFTWVRKDILEIIRQFEVRRKMMAESLTMLEKQKMLDEAGVDAALAAMQSKARVLKNIELLEDSQKKLLESVKTIHEREDFDPDKKSRCLSRTIEALTKAQEFLDKATTHPMIAAKSFHVNKTQNNVQLITKDIARERLERFRDKSLAEEIQQIDAD